MIKGNTEVSSLTTKIDFDSIEGFACDIFRIAYEIGHYDARLETSKLLFEEPYGEECRQIFF